MAYTGVVSLDSAFSISLSVKITKLIYSDVVTHKEKLYIYYYESSD